MKEKIKKYLLLTVILVGLFGLFFYTFAHPGRTDSSGCHTCRTNCPSWGLSYGEYHCHRVKALPQPKPPIKSHYDPEGSGWTEPAPEYKTPAPKEESSTSKNYTAEIPKDSNGGSSIWGWIIGLGIIGYLVYIFKNKKNK